jgi:hypothetical protein
MTTALALTADRAMVRELAERIKLLPGNDQMSPTIRLGLAQLCLAHGFDPFIGEAWIIPTKHGLRLMVGISAIRREAHRSGEYVGRVFRMCDADEREALGARPGDTAVRCIVLRRKTGQPTGEFDGYGLARADEKSTMNRLQLARLRAERDALKSAFPLDLTPGVDVGVSIGTSVGSEQPDDVDDESALMAAPGADVQVGVIDTEVVVDSRDGAAESAGNESADEQAGDGGHVDAQPERPYAPDVLRSGLQAAARRRDGESATPGQRGLVAGCLNEVFAGENADADRHALTRWVFGAESLNDLSGGQLLALYSWLKPAKDTGGHWSASEMSTREAHEALRRARLDAGKQDLFD